MRKEKLIKGDMVYIGEDKMLHRLYDISYSGNRIITAQVYINGKPEYVNPLSIKAVPSVEIADYPTK